MYELVMCAILGFAMKSNEKKGITSPCGKDLLFCESLLVGKVESGT